MMRSGNDALTNIFAREALYPHMNSIGGEMMEVLGSNTDFEKYSNVHIPGLDIAFYENCENYHTTNDNIHNFSPGSLQHMGSNAYAVIKKLLNIDISNFKYESSTSPFFDNYGRVGFIFYFSVRAVFCIMLIISSGLTLLCVYYLYEGEQKVGNFKCVVLGLAYHSFALLVCYVGSTVLTLPPILAPLFSEKAYLVSWSTIPLSFIGSFFGALITSMLWKKQVSLSNNSTFVEIFMPLQLGGNLLGSLFSFFCLYESSLSYRNTSHNNYSYLNINGI
jgi:hypothetical protein